MKRRSIPLTSVPVGRGGRNMRGHSNTEIGTGVGMEFGGTSGVSQDRGVGGGRFGRVSKEKGQSFGRSMAMRSVRRGRSKRGGGPV